MNDDLHDQKKPLDGSQNDVDIEASPERVFEVLLDPTTYPRWFVGAQSIRAVDPDWPAVGSKFHHRIGVGPLTIRGSTSVLRNDRPSELMLGAGLGPLGEATVRFTVEPHGGRSRVTVEEEPRNGLLRVAWGVLRPVIHLGLWGRNAVSLSSLDTEVLNRPRQGSAPPPD